VSLTALSPSTSIITRLNRPPWRATMLTRPADDVVAPFHERMPVILPADLVPAWLAGEPVSVDRLVTEAPVLLAEPLSRPGPEQPSLL
jgi:putative SOS response-associated peptidase YedK